MFPWPSHRFIPNQAIATYIIYALYSSGLLRRISRPKWRFRRLWAKYPPKVKRTSTWKIRSPLPNPKRENEAILYLWLDRSVIRTVLRRRGMDGRDERRPINQAAVRDCLLYLPVDLWTYRFCNFILGAIPAILWGGWSRRAATTWQSRGKGPFVMIMNGTL